MKKILALAIATALTSPVVLAANTPSNVGDVTYLGNIVANSPMWQWTVNDYPGGRLDAKPSTATTANGVTTYPLNGQAFIAASGYLPSFVGINVSSATATRVGTFDITSLTDQKGAAPANITDAQKGAVTFTISASGYNTSGQAVEGKLLLKATEVRGSRYATIPDSSTAPDTGTRFVVIFGGSNASFPTSSSSSCFAGVGSYTTGNIIGGTPDAPTAGEQSPTAFAAFVKALQESDARGSAPRFSTLPYPPAATKHPGDNNCFTSTISYLTATNTTFRTPYLAAAHVLELTPVELQFTTPLSGGWNSALTVTAYTM